MRTQKPVPLRLSSDPCQVARPRHTQLPGPAISFPVPLVGWRRLAASHTASSAAGPQSAQRLTMSYMKPQVPVSRSGALERRRQGLEAVGAQAVHNF